MPKKSATIRSKERRPRLPQGMFLLRRDEKEKERITMKRFLAMMLAGTMCLSMAACAKPADDGAGDSGAAGGEGGEKKTVGVCIYKFDDAFMTTYRNALQSMLEEKGYEVSVVDGNNDQAKQTEQILSLIHI